MAKKIFVCKNCGDTYFSKKENSSFCSLECKHNYNRFTYNCDYCGKEMIIYRNQYEKLKNGEKKNKYCCRECADNGQKTSVEKQCLNCGSSFMTFQCTKDINKFCSRTCFEEYKTKNAILNQPKQCLQCGKIFYSERRDAKFCSYNCSGLYQQNRELCKCDYCGCEFERIVSEVSKRNKHFCSKTCKQLSQKWNNDDVQVLVENYGKINTRDIIPLLSKPYTVNAIRSEAGRRDLWKSRIWSDEETEILINMYPNYPMNDVLNALPKRSVPSILGKARVLGLKSFFYNQRIYSDEDTSFIKENYLTMTNQEIGERLNRTAGAIQQKLWILDLKRPFNPKDVCYQDLASYVRGQNASWRNHIFADCNYTCMITGKQRDVVVHHIRGFNLLLQECLETLNFEIKDNFEDYNVNDLDRLLDCFFELQESYGEYICINKDLHVLFHNTYGYGDNTSEQWNEFVNDYKNGKYKQIA